MDTPNKIRKLRVGVSILVNGTEQSYWDNGILQNCLYLVMLLTNSPIVEAAYLVSSSTINAPFLSNSSVSVITMTEAIGLDVMIEMSAQLSPAWISQFRGKVVTMRCGNDYVLDVERTIFNQHCTPKYGVRYDAVWTIPQYEATCLSYFATVYRAPASVLPHLWSPVVLEQAIAAHSGFGYQPGKKVWSLAIMEPNRSIVKTCHIPLLVVDALYRTHPHLINKVSCYNTSHIANNELFKSFTQSLDIKPILPGTEPTYKAMNTNDALVCHSWENEQNYIYYEALYGNYPLIHNSTFLQGCGYQYNGFDCADGSNQLYTAILSHDTNLNVYKANASKFLHGLSPYNETNIRLYTKAIEQLYNT